ncbi:hypothetical protein ISS07_06465 [Candidatus Woesearchaeota archaeon]|nr:hypothetical protein [Candidatus Woesearchaeota archaeon]
MENKGKKLLVLRFDVDPKNIKTSMKTENVSPQEAIGLLEMAKDQILENLRKGRNDIFQMSKTGKDEEK